MAAFTTIIQFAGHDLHINGHYHPAESASATSPGCDELYEIDSMFIGEHPICVGEIMEPHMPDIIKILKGQRYE